MEGGYQYFPNNSQIKRRIEFGETSRRKSPLNALLGGMKMVALCTKEHGHFDCAVVVGIGSNGLNASEEHGPRHQHGKACVTVSRHVSLYLRFGQHVVDLCFAKKTD